MCPEELVDICEETIVDSVTRSQTRSQALFRAWGDQGPLMESTRIVYPASQFGLHEPLPPLHSSRLYKYKKYNYPLGAAAREDIAAWPAAVAANLERFLSASARQP